MSLIDRIKDGASRLTLEQQLSAKKAGVIGQVLGMALATSYLVFYKGYWYWFLFFFFTVFVMVVELLGVNKQLVQLRKMNNLIGGRK
jgi:hypothetical protein